MHYHTIERLRRGEHQQAVEVQIPLCAATAPARFLAAYRYPSVINAYYRRVIRHTLRNDLLRPFDKLTELGFGQLASRSHRRLSNLRLFYVRIYPLLIFAQKLAYRSVACRARTMSLSFFISTAKVLLSLLIISSSISSPRLFINYSRGGTFAQRKKPRVFGVNTRGFLCADFLIFEEFIMALWM